MFEWSKDFSVGIDKIDEQHKKLFNLINRLNSCIGQKESDECAERILNEIVDYTNYHFDYEEKFLEENNYNEVIGHKIIHKKFIARLKSCGNQKQIDILRLYYLLLDWLKVHILEEDMQYARYFKLHGLVDTRDE